MADVFSLTEARARFSEIMNRVIYKNEKVILSRRGRNVAIIIPFEDFSRIIMDDELLDANPLLADTESITEDIADSLYD